MTHETLRHAIRVIVQNAHCAGHLTHGSQLSLVSAIAYAEGVLMPIVEARIEQGVEEAWLNDKAANAPAAAQPCGAA